MMMMMMRQRLERRDIVHTERALALDSDSGLAVIAAASLLFVVVILLHYYYYYYYDFFFSLDGILTAHTIIIAKTMTIV